MTILPHKFITPEGLDTLKQHKYKGGEYTYLDNQMNKFWYMCIDFMPETIAPNMITLAGLLVIISSVLLMWATGDSFSSERPAFVYFYSSISLFIY